MRPYRAERFIFFVVDVLVLWNVAHGYFPIVKKLSLGDIQNIQQEAVTNTTKGNLIYLDPDHQYQLGWEYDNDTITFDVNVRARGWVGLGFTRSRGMAGADIVVVWVDANGKGQISDRHSKENGYPELDKNQNYTLLSASRNESNIRARFRRPKNTCDRDDARTHYQLNSTAENVRVIWAYSDIQPSDAEHLAKHEFTKRGVKGLFLFDPPIEHIDFPPDTVTLDLLADSVPLPTDYHLMYWCQIFELPKWPVHHLMRLEAVLQKGNEPYVHHVALYQCNKNKSDHVETGQRCFNGDGSDGNFSSVYDGCMLNVLWFWNPGMGTSDLPDGVGLPMFESPSDAYVLLEMHYENLDLKPGLVDSSGLRIYLTPTARPIEAGVMLLGTPEQPHNEILPPGQPIFRFYGHYEHCLTSQFLPPTGINVVSALLHAHVYGTGVRMHHYRNGVKLKDYGVDKNYDFYSQSFRPLSPYRLVLPGDQLVMECRYNTSNTNKTVYGGFSTLEEMCGSTQYYYPRIAKKFTCMSYPDPAEYVPLFGGELSDDNATVLLPSINETIPLDVFVRTSVDWTVPGVLNKYTDLVTNGQYAQLFFYQPLKNKNSTDDPPEQVLNFTHTGGYPKVDHPWTEGKSVRKHNCPSHKNTSQHAANKTLKAVPPPMRLIEKSSAMTKNNWYFHWVMVIDVVFAFLICDRS